MKKAKPTVRADDFRSAAPAGTDPKSLDELLGYAPSDDERQYLELLRWVETKGDVKDLKDAFNQEITRLKRVHAFAQTWRAENPDVERFDAATAELADGTTYRSVVGRPAISADMRRRLELQKVKAEAAAEADARIAAERQATDKRLRAMETKPQIEKTVSDLRTGLLDGVTIDSDAEVNDELMKLARGQGLDALVAELPGEGEIVRGHVEAATARVNALLHITSGLVEIDAANPIHIWLMDFVTQEADWFAANGGDDRVRQGRTFIPPAKYGQLKPEAADRYWTFSRDDMVKMIAHRSKQDMQTQLENYRVALEKREQARGKFKKPAAPTPAPAPVGAPTPAPAPDPEPSPAPRLRPTPSGSGGTPPAPTTSRVKQRLGLA